MELPHQIGLATGELDLLRRVIRRDGEDVPLTGLEVDLVRYLAARPGVAVSRRELLAEVWGYGRGVRSRAVDNTVRRLRSKIEADPSDPQVLCTVHGHGYRWDAPEATGDATVTMTSRASAFKEGPVPVLALVHHDDPAWVGRRAVLSKEPLQLGREATAFGPGALADGRISRRHLELRVEGGAVLLRDLESRNGTFVNGHRVSQRELAPGDVVELGAVLLLFHLEPEAHEPPRHPVLVGRSAAWREVLGQVARLAVIDDPVVVVGEPGTGKHTVAEVLASSGDPERIRVAASSEGFPAGLAVLALPPLRTRRDDILPLARHFAGPHPIGTDLALALLREPWPGNVAQLREVVERAAEASADGVLRAGSVRHLLGQSLMSS